jgi:hypothetical protein
MIERRRWWLDAVCPERVAGRGQGAELAARAQGSARCLHAPLLAEGSSSRWLVEGAPADENTVTGD